MISLIKSLQIPVEIKFCQNAQDGRGVNCSLIVHVSISSSIFQFKSKWDYRYIPLDPLFYSNNNSSQKKHLCAIDSGKTSSKSPPTMPISLPAPRMKNEGTKKRHTTRPYKE
jgi:hypothetical protein